MASIPIPKFFDKPEEHPAIGQVFSRLGHCGVCVMVVVEGDQTFYDIEFSQYIRLWYNAAHIGTGNIIDWEKFYE